jgi:hypothetical protein
VSSIRLVLFGSTLLLIVACTPNDRPAISQNAVSSNVINEKAVRTVDCNKPDEYSFKVVDNLNRKGEGEPLTPKDLNIVIGEETIAAIELPIPDSEAKNFSLNAIEKTKRGFEIRVEWGGGLYHYEIQFNFRCKENNFFLYKVKNENFSTTNPNSGNFWDKKETKITNIEPNLPIKKFAMLDYLE